MSATQDLLDFAFAEHHLSGQVRAATQRLIADTLAVGAAGWSGPGMAGVLATAQGWGAGGTCRLLGDSTLRLPANGAAYANCFAIHCLEWDAVHEGAVVHAMTAVVPAVMAALDQGGEHDPEAVLAAVAVGVDVAAGLGIAARGGLRFFRPAIAGIYGAALAVARIRRLPRSAFADVLGLAHAHAAGTMQAHSEGSIALPLQFANAARSALHAVELVANGLSGPHDPLEGRFGHFALFEEGELAAYTSTLGTWHIADQRLAEVAASVTIADDGNSDVNAMSPQRLDVLLASGERRSLAIPATLGSPGRPLSEAEAAAKYALYRGLAPAACDPRLFSAPLAYLVGP